jgi:O-antigen/teichoic acid export membrane protein
MTRFSSLSTDPGRLARSSAWNVVGFVATLAAHFVTVPIVIAAIGLAEFGRAGLVIATWAPFLLVGTVIGQSALREVSALFGTSEETRARRVAWSALTLAGLVGVIVCAVLVAFGPAALRLLAGAQYDSVDWRIAFLCSGVGWFAQQIGLVYQGIAAAAQNYRAIAAATVLSAAVMVAATIEFVRVAPRMEAYLLGISAGFVAGALVWPFLLHSFRQAGRWSAFAKERADLIRFGKWQGTNHVAAALGNQVDRYLLAALAAPQILGEFNAANRLQEAAYAGLAKVTEVLFPYFGLLSTRRDEANLEAVLSSSWVVALFSGALLGPIVPLAHPLLVAWAGGEIGALGGTMMQTLVLGGIAGSGANVITYYFLATGRAKRIATLSVVFSAATIVAAAALFFAIGPYAAGGGALAISVVRMPVMLAQFRREAVRSAPWGALLVSSALPIGCAMAFGVLTAYLYDDPPTSWRGLGLAYAAGVAAFGAVTIAVSAVFPTGRRVIALLYGGIRARWR